MHFGFVYGNEFQFQSTHFELKFSDRHLPKNKFDSAGYITPAEGVRALGYDLHIVRTPDWTDAADSPILRDEVASLVEADPELKWSSTEFVDSVGDGGEAVRLPFIKWRGTSCFLWDRNQVICKNPDETHIAKMIGMAGILQAMVVGDDGEQYTLRRSLFGRMKIRTTKP